MVLGRANKVNGRGVFFLLTKNAALVLVMLFLDSALHAQSKKHSANFTLFQQYYNPAFTGFEGSSAKAYYRNQWAGFEGAPKTLFISTEISLSDHTPQAPSVLDVDPSFNSVGIRHSVGLSIVHDSFGPFVENQIFASYRSLSNITDQVKLQAGIAVAYHSQTLDGSKLTSDEADDPSLQTYLNRTSRSGRMDLNIGLALSGQNFYAGYGMHNVRGQFARTKHDLFSNNKINYIVQGGYRRSLSDEVGLVFNGLFRFDDRLKETFEGQVKSVFYNTAWLGLGYRYSLAYSLIVGFRLNQWRLGYGYEIPAGDAQMTGSGTNELMVTYDLKKIIHPRVTRQMSIW
jgi:type IX secretion system PorP/SprF family membrane protein